jgi:transcriptional regulator with XRE-family HTH domain
MNAKQYREKFGKLGCEALAEAAGTSYAYVYQIAIGHRRPSVELAQRLVEASNGQLDLISLLTQKTNAA